MVHSQLPFGWLDNQGVRLQCLCCHLTVFIVFLVLYLVLFELPIDQQRRLFINFLSDGMSHSIVRLQTSVETGITILIIYILLGVSTGRKGNRH